jgi:hypothetical protein
MAIFLYLAAPAKEMSTILGNFNAAVVHIPAFFSISSKK